MSQPIPDTVLDELLGRGLSYKQWRIILEGEIFNDCIGGRYFTEWQRLWQHNFGCTSFRYNSSIKQRIIEQEFNMFRSEIECMVLEGYSFKSIAKRLRGEIWTTDGLEEREDRLKMQRLFGCDARSRMFRSVAKKWATEETAVKPPFIQQEGKVEALQQNHNQTSIQQKSLHSPAGSDPPRSLWIPETFVTSKTGQSFRCSFSAVGALALQSESQLLDQTRELWMPPEAIPSRPHEARHSRTLWSPREANLCQAMFNLRLDTQQTREELRAVKADLQSIRAGFKEHEREIAVLQSRQAGGIVPNESTAQEIEAKQPVDGMDLRNDEEQESEIALLREQRPESTTLKEGPLERTKTEQTEPVDELAWLMEAESEEKEAENRSRFRRRGRIFPCTSPKVVPPPALHLASHQCSKIPIRAPPKPNPPLVAATAASGDLVKLDTSGCWSRWPIPIETQLRYDEIMQDRRGRTSDANRDSGYASPSSACGSASTDTVLDECVRLDVVSECMEG